MGSRGADVSDVLSASPAVLGELLYPEGKNLPAFIFATLLSQEPCLWQMDKCLTDEQMICLHIRQLTPPPSPTCPTAAECCSVAWDTVSGLSDHTSLDEFGGFYLLVFLCNFIPRAGFATGDAPSRACQGCSAEMESSLNPAPAQPSGTGMASFPELASSAMRKGLVLRTMVAP